MHRNSNHPTIFIVQMVKVNTMIQNQFNFIEAQKFVAEMFQSVLDDDYPDTEDTCICELVQDWDATEEQAQEVLDSDWYKFM